ncbi:aldehyde dehydrogenase [Marinomonas rhizomae]|uniref:Acyl-CoA reductase-like NAD-dependent aldehyde dehydrogenase n=1 Tax=Marinomonas rhizomae TaxID=491948 RepID=A0A366IZK9_9GAMM|nr:aldehyde dehydrogenase [Marinomonas rhizomae]RBP79148.1 acyl-CoA reductase-like NAD-dependent aldehyde dehydrogenase [Marinomonas rhizomae]RNF70440.1 aldehyde dehydrogenase [Marinomonas rhizomae]
MTVLLSIGGNDQASSDHKEYNRLDPVTGAIASTSAAATIDDVNAITNAANKAFPAWAQTGPTERRNLLNKAADIMEAKQDEFIAAMITETGATGPWAGFNVMLAAGHIREAAALTTQMGGEVIPSNKPGTLAMSVNKPKGVCLAIAPWNAPIILGARAIATPLACGNTVILKSSEFCPLTHRLIIDCFLEAGFPAGVVNLLSNDPSEAASIVKALIEAPEVRHVNFTGSSPVGRIIGRLAGENLKPALLELGGKAPLLVLSDADIEGAVNAAIFGAFMNQGQICMSTERVIVDASIADDFVAKLVARASTLPWGNPREAVVLGSLVNPEVSDKMQALIDDAVSKGAKLVCGGENDGAMFSATLLDGVNQSMRIYTEESFGPVKSIIRVNGDEEAIKVANDSEYGLSAAVFSQDINRALACANAINSGICHINGPTVGDEPQMPFGGVSDSGYGRFGGKAGIAEFTDSRWITVEDPKQHYPF